jgi:hypothetical protein
MNKPFDFSTLKTDRTWKYVYDKLRGKDEIDSSERFHVRSEVHDKNGVIYKTRSMRDAKSTQRYLSDVWGAAC